MMSYEKVDAWKGCHELLMAVLDTAKGYQGREKKVVGRLVYTAMRAAGRIAFGKGTGNRQMFLRATARAGGFLSEFQYYLSLVRVMAILPEPVCGSFDALRGRASFYVHQLMESLLAPRRRGGTGD
jgi:hypothetical protein